MKPLPQEILLQRMHSQLVSSINHIVHSNLEPLGGEGDMYISKKARGDNKTKKTERHATSETKSSGEGIPKGPKPGLLHANEQSPATEQSGMEASKDLMSLDLEGSLGSQEGTQQSDEAESSESHDSHISDSDIEIE